MAEIRFNYGDKFTQTTDTNTGIGSTIPAGKLDVAGNTSAGSFRVSGIATLSSYQGFVNTKLSTTEDLIVEAGQSGSVSGEVVISPNTVGVGTTSLIPAISVSVSTGATAGQGGIQSLKVYKTFMPPVGGTVDRPTDVKPGMVYYNKDFKTIEFWDGNFWKQVDNTTIRGRAIHAGGADPSPNSYTGFMSVFEMATQGNAIEFGTLLKAGQGHEGLSSSTRGLFTGRKTPSANPDDDIEYLTIASRGETIFFGNLSSARRLAGTFSSSTRGIVAGGLSPSYLNIIDYVEISTLGNALDFGDTMSTEALNAGCSSPTKGIFNSGRVTSPSTVWESRVEEVTIASKGNSVKFGDLTYAPGSNAAFSNSIRGFFAGGHTNPNYTGINPGPIDYISLASGGNGIRFGDLSSQNSSLTATASPIRGFMMGGNNPAITNLIEFVTISTLGNAQDFGDLVNKLESGGSLSDSHGGLGGF